MCVYELGKDEDKKTPPGITRPVKRSRKTGGPIFFFFFERKSSTLRRGKKKEGSGCTVVGANLGLSGPIIASQNGGRTTEGRTGRTP